jgi:hypothetical protein
MIAGQIWMKIQPGFPVDSRSNYYFQNMASGHLCPLVKQREVLTLLYQDNQVHFTKLFLRMKGLGQ